MSTKIFVLPVIALSLIAIYFSIRRMIGKVTVMEYQLGLLYRDGHFVRLLSPGLHRYWNSRFRIEIVDMRLMSATIAGQEVLSADNIGLKVSIAATFKIVDPIKALHSSENFRDMLYLMLQVALRDLVGELPIDDIMERRRDISQKLLEAVQAKALELGVALQAVSIKDIMFPGDLKNVFAQVVNARKEGLASLERARGETAALRHLANAAKLMEGNPELMQLRLLQSLKEGSGNTIVLKMPNADEESGLDRGRE